jgi:hypothetical protein
LIHSDVPPILNIIITKTERFYKQALGVVSTGAPVPPRAQTMVTPQRETGEKAKKPDEGGKKTHCNNIIKCRFFNVLCKPARDWFAGFSVSEHGRKTTHTDGYFGRFIEYKPGDFSVKC